MEPVLLAEPGCSDSRVPKPPMCSCGSKKPLGAAGEALPAAFSACVMNFLLSESSTSPRISVSMLAVLFCSALVFILRASVVLGNERIIVNIQNQMDSARFHPFGGRQIMLLQL